MAFIQALSLLLCWYNCTSKGEVKESALDSMIVYSPACMRDEAFERYSVKKYAISASHDIVFWTLQGILDSLI